MLNELKSVPDFIGIGAVKTATSWLHKILDSHPEVWMPPIKELHFFDRKEDSSHLTQILFKKKDYLLSRNRWRSSSKKLTRWNLNYFCNKRTPQYYSQLFLPEQSQICGEITPAYSILEKAKIEQIKKQTPNAKIIYLLRNPIDRDWSQLCMTVQNAHNLDVTKLSNKEIIGYYEEKYFAQSSYVNHLKNWESIFGKEQIFVGFYDEIVEDPNSFLLKLFEFLSISKSSAGLDKTKLSQKVNSYSQNLNDEVRHFLVHKEYENIEKVNDKFNNSFTNKWLKDANIYR